MLPRLFRWILGAAFVILSAAFTLFLRPSEQTLVVTPQVISQLRALREEPKFTDLPGAPAAAERRRTEPLFDELLDSLLVGLPQNPSKKWVLAQLDPVVAKFHLEDTELRERCVVYVQRILDIVGVEKTDGVFYKYFIFI